MASEKDPEQVESLRKKKACHHIKQPIWRNGEVLSPRQQMAFYTEWYHTTKSKLFGCPLCGGSTNESVSHTRNCRHCGHLCLPSDYMTISDFTIEERVDRQAAHLQCCCVRHGTVGCNGEQPDRSKPHQILDMSVNEQQHPVTSEWASNFMTFSKVFDTPFARKCLDTLLRQEILVEEVQSGRMLCALLDALELEFIAHGGNLGFFNNRDSLLDAWKVGKFYTCVVKENDFSWDNNKLVDQLRKCGERLLPNRLGPQFMSGCDFYLPCFMALSEDGKSIEYLWIHQALQNKGLGRKMVESQQLVKKHVTRALNTSRGFWDKMGFTYDLTYKHVQ